MKKVVLVLLLSVAKSLFCQAVFLQLNPILITNLDTTFRAVIENHLAEMRKEELLNPMDTFLIITISPAISVADGIPQSIIDSIYNKNTFPLESYSNNYNLVVLSLSFDCRYFNAIKSIKYKYYYRYNNINVMIVSSLNIEFPNNNKTYSMNVCSTYPCDKSCMEKFDKKSTYSYSYYDVVKTEFVDIWLRNNKLINHPRKKSNY